MFGYIKKLDDIFVLFQFIYTVRSKCFCTDNRLVLRLFGSNGNLILHGIQPRSAPGRVTIEVKQLAGGIRVAVRDTGYGISQAVIDGVAAGRVESRSIGLMNVHQRVKLLYGDGLHLKRLEPGTEVCFYLPDQEAMPC